MNTRLFLDRVLSGEGFYCLLARKRTSNIQKFYSSVGELLQAAQKFDSEGYDSYYALSTFEEEGSRRGHNVASISSFFLDLDCGEGKDYPNQREAMEGLKSFCHNLSLPRPTIINSGRGLHVYWTLHEPVTPKEWLPVAQQLKEICVIKGLRADSAVTADMSRVLRVPDTHNYKQDPPLPVGFICEGDSVNYDVFYEFIGGDALSAPKVMGEGEEDNSYDNFDSHFVDILKKSKNNKGCRQIKLAIQNKNSVNEPTWRGILSILKSCCDGSREKAHIISRGHVGYSERETDYKWDNIQPSMPYTCSTFNDNNPDVCIGCTHYGRIGSPITLGNRAKEATNNVVEAPAINLPNAPTTTYVIPPYPKPYFRPEGGGVRVRTVNSDGDPDEKPIYHNDIYVVKRIRDVEVGESIVMRLHLPKDGVREFTIPLTAVTSREEFRKQMSMQGVALMRMDDLMQYTTTWVNELQASGGATMAHKQFGWVGDNCESFVLGNQEIFKDKIEFNPPSTQTAALMGAFEPRGSLEKWKETINFYNRDGFELHQYVVGTAFGSILMKFMGEISCAALHLHSKESGVGKTTALLAALSVWGKPDELLLHERDTYNSKMNRGEVMHNLPLCMDELTNSTGKQLSDIAYQFTSGKQRMRMAGGTNVERYRGEPWNLLAVTTGNTSIVELIGVYKAMPKAEAQRILEIQVPRMFKGAESKGDTDTFARDIETNCGWAGPEFVKYIINNLDTVRFLLKEVQGKVDKRARLSSENRFWSAGIAATLTGLVLAKRAGLHDFDVSSIFNWIVKQVISNKVRADDMGASALQTLNDYIHDNWGSILWIKSTDDLRKSDAVVVPEVMPKGKLVARYETDVKKMYLIPKPLKEWCGKQQINYSSFIDELKEKAEGHRDKVRLGKGTNIVLPSSWVFVVNCDIDVEAIRPQP
jgi:hypothetical protein